MVTGNIVTLIRERGKSINNQNQTNWLGETYKSRFFALTIQFHNFHCKYPHLCGKWHLFLTLKVKYLDVDQKTLQPLVDSKQRVKGIYFLFRVKNCFVEPTATAAGEEDHGKTSGWLKSSASAKACLQRKWCCKTFSCELPSTVLQNCNTPFRIKRDKNFAPGLSR